ncbi:MULTISPECIES: GPW/gp25 family protein [Streptomyces]|uniref:GPW/gp25 family protein n=2 Tax=Streptomyces TaxID=1883 RepID=A0ABU4K1L7_9ACTN|nr:GPW/gp25 family protein [Streptomyces roseolus]MDX2291654.1 GPW/gp25 family protein [Streptomyces roseolus]
MIGQADPSRTGILGRGWAAPVAVGSLGEIEPAGDADKVRQSILLILRTGRGERVMRPDFGAGLDDFLYEPVSATTAELVRHRVEQALVVWEPRIDAVEVAVSASERDAGRLDVEVRYRIRSSNTFYNLVYPFFLHERARR